MSHIKLIRIANAVARFEKRAKVYTQKEVAEELHELKGIAPTKTWAQAKDRQRISDILEKSRDERDILKLVKRMAESIDDPAKAARRGDAAEKSDDPTMSGEGAQIFFNRALDLIWDMF